MITFSTRVQIICITLIDYVLIRLASVGHLPIAYSVGISFKKIYRTLIISRSIQFISNFFAKIWRTHCTKNTFIVLTIDP